MNLLFIKIFLWAILFSPSSLGPPKINLEINNSYSYDVTILVKCDWNSKKQNFDYKNNFLLLGNSTKTIHVPNNLKNCRIWAKINFF